MNQVQQINIDNVLKEKSPRLHKILPRFIINWLKKTLHEKDINQILRELEDKHEIEFINNGLKKLGVKSEGVGTNNIPNKNGVILVASDIPTLSFHFAYFDALVTTPCKRTSIISIFV